MTWFTKWSFGNKSAVWLMVLMILGFGTASYFTLPMELLPEANNPQVTVTVLGQGFDSKSMVTAATDPIELAVSAVKGKTSVFSSTGDGFAKIDINFDSKADMKEAKAEVTEAVSAIPFPQGLSKPYVVQFNTSMIPISQVSLSFKDGMTRGNMETAEKEILPLLQKVKGVGNVQLYGKSSPQVMIEADSKKLADKHLPFQALLGTVQGKNYSSAVGEKPLDGKTSGIKVVGSLTDLDTLKRVELAPGVQLQDVASVSSKVNQENVTHVNGKDAMFLVVTKSANSNAVKVGNGVEAAVKDINANFPNAQADVFFNSSESVVTSVNSMMKEVLMGALFATLVILFFLRSIRSTLITIVSIPLSLALTLYLLSKSGVTLNILTLGGVAVAVGRLVDDSIVVIENIFRRTQKEAMSKDLVISATREVATAITSSTLTTVAVFLPMGLLGGSLQAFLLPFALTVTYSLLASLLVALTVVPLLSAALLKNSKLHEHKEPKRYMSLLRWNLNHKWLPLVLSFLVFAGSIAAYMVMPKGAVATGGSGFITMKLSYPPEKPAADVKEKAIELEKFIIAQPGAKITALQIGSSEDGAKYGDVSPVTDATYTVVMKKDADLADFKAKVNEQKSNYSGAALVVDDGSFTGASSSTISIDVLGKKAEDLQTASKSVMDAIKGISGIVKVSSNQEATKPGYEVVVDSTVSSPQHISMELASLLNPMPIGSMLLEDKETKVVLKNLFDPKTGTELSDLPISTSAGVVPLSKVAKIEKTEEITSVLHKDGHLYIRVTAQVDSSKLSVIGTEITTKTKELKLPDGVTIQTGGAAQQQSEDFSQLLITMLAALGLVYLIMVVTFKSLRGPLAIICSLPLAAIGAVLGLIVSRISPDFTAAFGALMLIGVVVTNAIVLIDRIKQNESKMSIRESIIEAASTRIRPILMTAVATICAMSPLLFAKTEAGMSIVSKSLAIVVIGGLSVATVLTLLIVPVIYEALHFRKSKRQRVQQQRETEVSL